MCVDDVFTRLAHIFAHNSDIEIAAVICAWFCNCVDDDREAEYVINKTLRFTMGNEPTSYVVNERWKDNTENVYFRILTNDSFIALMKSLKEIYTSTTLSVLLTRKKNTHTYTMLAELLGGNTGLPTRQSKCSYYSYNLITYWLTYKAHVWNRSISRKALLPVTQTVWQRAIKLGFTKKREISFDNIRSLTSKSKELFGDDDYYKMYELLKYGL